jgi:hypothetical protein
VCWSGRFLPVNVQGLASAAACNSRLRSRRSFGFFLTRKSAKLANPMPCYSLSPWVAEEVRKCYNGLLDGENGSRPGALCSCNDLVDLRQKVVSWRADRSDDLALFQSVIQGGVGVDSVHEQKKQMGKKAEGLAAAKPCMIEAVCMHALHPHHTQCYPTSHRSQPMSVAASCP